jgi:FkbM family methyltransferase
MTILKSLLSKVASNCFMQKMLEINVLASQYMMGIGSGGGVQDSGEQSVFRVLKQFQPPYCIFDVGSNKGQFLQLIIDHIGDHNFTTHCFEPSLETFKRLTEVSKGDGRIRLNNMAVGKEKGQGVLYSDRAESEIASLTKRKLDHFSIDFNKTETVEINTIDSYCSDNLISHINLLKMDIEGHELDALVGAKRMLAERAIDIVMFEFGGCNIDTRTFFQDYWYFFKERDFSIFRITPSGYLHPIKSYKEIHEQFRATNFLAMLKGGQNCC